MTKQLLTSVVLLSLIACVSVKDKSSTSKKYTSIFDGKSALGEGVQKKYENQVRKMLDFDGFRGHDFKVLDDIFDRNLNLVLGVVSPTCTHSGGLLDIINSVSGVRDT